MLDQTLIRACVNLMLASSPTNGAKQELSPIIGENFNSHQGINFDGLATKPLGRRRGPWCGLLEATFRAAVAMISKSDAKWGFCGMGIVLVHQ